MPRPVQFDVTIRHDPNITDRLDQIISILHEIQQTEATVMADLTQLTADVAANDDAIASAVTLLQGLKTALDAAGTDPAALAALSADIEAHTQSLADAVTANTPAAP